MFSMTLAKATRSNTNANTLYNSVIVTVPLSFT